MASSRKYLGQMKGRFRKNDPEDIVAMVNALAVMWVEARGRSDSRPTQADYRLAAQIFGVLPHPRQPARLPAQAGYLARQFAGVARDREQYRKFRNSVSLGLLAISKDIDAVFDELERTGIGGLFRL